MHAVVARIRDGNAAPGVRRSAAKILLSLCLAEPNRRVAVEAGAVGAVVEGAVEMAEEGTTAAERALAALELMCTVREGADEVRGHALAVPAMVGVMGRVEGRGREHAMGVLAVAFGGGGTGRKDHGALATATPSTVLAEEVAKAVELALKGECSERGRRKGKQLLKLLRGLNGGGDGTDDADGCRTSLSRDSDFVVNSA